MKLVQISWVIYMKKDIIYSWNMRQHNKNQITHCTQFYEGVPKSKTNSFAFSY